MMKKKRLAVVIVDQIRGKIAEINLLFVVELFVYDVYYFSLILKVTKGIIGDLKDSLKKDQKEDL